MNGRDGDLGQLGLTRRRSLESATCFTRAPFYFLADDTWRHACEIGGSSCPRVLRPSPFVMGKGKPSKKMSKKAMGPAGFNAATKASGGRHANMSQHAVSKKQKKKAQKGQRRLMAAAAAAGGSKSKDMDASRAGPYSPQQATLLIGEGDFSFAAAIAMIWRDAQNLVATAFDDEESAARKYATLAENVETVRQCGGTVLFGVDATKCHTHKVLKRMAGGFDRVVFKCVHRVFASTYRRILHRAVTCTLCAPSSLLTAASLGSHCALLQLPAPWHRHEGHGP